MSEHYLAADHDTGYTLHGLGCLKDQRGTIFISNEELAQLAGSGRHCLIIPVLPSEPEQEAATAAGQPVSAPSTANATARRPGRELKAVAIGASIGVSIGVAVASGLTLMIQKTGVDIAAIVQQALIYVG